MESNFGVTYMWAAYAAVWLIHAAYLLWLRGQKNQLKRDIEESRRG